MTRRIAVLGATSQLAGDYVAQAAAGDDALVLFARDPAAAARGMARRGCDGRFPVAPLDAFGTDDFDAVLNCIGVGDPARAVEMGAGIFDATRRWDDRVLAFLRDRPATRYVFLSSGAVYGDAFDHPVTSDSQAIYPVNRLGPSNWYALAKLSAEAAHRATPDRSIIDLRIFNYVSRTQDPAMRFLVTDMIRAVREARVFETTHQSITRDFLDPPGLFALISAAFAAPAGTNAPADAYSRAPIEKLALLGVMADTFGLDYRFVDSADTVQATGAKPHYYSLDRTAAAWGYDPPHSSAEVIVAEAGAMLAAKRDWP